MAESAKLEDPNELSSSETVSSTESTVSKPLSKTPLVLRVTASPLPHVDIEEAALQATKHSISTSHGDFTVPHF